MSTEKNDLIFYCYLAYVGPFWFVGLFSGSRNRSLRFHVNQGLLLFITELLAFFLVRAAGGLLELLPFANIGIWIYRLVWLAVTAVFLYLSARGMLNVARNVKEELPIIGIFRIIN